MQKFLTLLLLSPLAFAEIAVYADGNSKFKSKLAAHAELLLKANPQCEASYVDQSTNSKKKYYIMCEDFKKLYFTKEDMKKKVSKKIEEVPHLSNDKAIESCQALIVTQLNNPRTFKPTFGGTVVAQVGNSRSRVTITFKAKNGLGNTLKYEAICLVGNGVSEIQNLEQL